MSMYGENHYNKKNSKRKKLILKKLLIQHCARFWIGIHSGPNHGGFSSQEHGERVMV